MSNDFNALLEEYKKKKKKGNNSTGTKTSTSSASKSSGGDFQSLVEEYRQEKGKKKVDREKKSQALKEALRKIAEQSKKGDDSTHIVSDDTPIINPSYPSRYSSPQAPVRQNIAGKAVELPYKRDKAQEEYEEAVRKAILMGKEAAETAVVNNSATSKYSSPQSPVRQNIAGSVVAPYVQNVLADPNHQEVISANKEAQKLDFFQKGALSNIDLGKAFEDGWQKGDLINTVVDTASSIGDTILGTAGDAALNIGKGFAGVAEGIADAGGYGVAWAADLLGADDYARDVRKNAAENWVDKYTQKPETYLNQYSVLDRTSDSVMQGVGQVGAVMSVGAFGQTAGLGGTGVSALTTGTMGLSGVGSGTSEAYQNGATDLEALQYGLASGAIDAVSEMIFGGLGKSLNALGFSKGLSSADDMFAKALTKNMKNQIAKNIVEFGVKAGAEGLEEVIAGIGQAYAKSKTYMSEEDFWKILEDENLLEQFVVGAATSGIAQGGDLRNANMNKADFITGQTQNEQAVIKKEIENRIADAEKDGKKLTAKEKSALEAKVAEDMEKGYISTDTIESVLDTDPEYDNLVKESEEFKSLYETTDNLSEKQRDRLTELKEKNKANPYEKALEEAKKSRSERVFEIVKNDRLIESYNEKGRRSQKFEADLSQYTPAQRKIVQKAINSGVLNNTNRSHEFVDLVAKIAADKNLDFDFADNVKLKETGFALDGVTVNGFVNENGVTVNLNSAKALNSVVGHEVTHVLEGTDLYESLKQVVAEYAKNKGEYDARLEQLTELYNGKEGYTGEDASTKIEQEVVADLVGDYLFADADFVNNLSTNHRNVFQKIFDEIKYLCKAATAGSKEARELEKVKKIFEEAYRAETKNPTTEGGVKYSIVALDNGNVYVKASRNVITGTTKADQRKNITDFFNDLLEGNSSLDIQTIEGDILTITKAETADKARDDYKTVQGQPLKMTDAEFLVKLRAEAHIDELAEISHKNNRPPVPDGKNHAFAKDGFTYRRAYFEDFDGQYYEITLSIGHNGTVATVYNVGKISKGALPSAKIIAVVGSKALGKTPSKSSLSKTTENVNTQNSLSNPNTDIAPLPWNIKGEDVAYIDSTESRPMQAADQYAPVVENAAEAEAGHSLSSVDNGQKLDYDSSITETEGGITSDERREETRESFHRRANEKKYTVRERGKIACGYYPATDKTGRAGRTEKALQELGIPVVVHEGLESNADGVTNIIQGDAASVAGDAVYVRNTLETDPIETAGHEAFHFWKHTNERVSYREVVADNIDFSSDDFIQFQDEIARKYFGKEISIDDVTADKLSEEIFAYITGLVHAGDSDNIVRPFLRDYDAVKAAWNALIEKNTHLSSSQQASGRPQFDDIAPVGNLKISDTTNMQAPIAKNATGVFFDDLGPVATDDIGPVAEEYEVNRLAPKKQPKMVGADKPAEQKTANILVDEPKVEEKKNRLWSMVKENILDNGMVFEDLALKTGNRDLQAKWNFIRYSQSRAQRMIGKGAENVKSLNAIREEVEKSRKTQEFYEYLYHWLNVDRMSLKTRYEDTPNKSVFGDTVTADMSRAIAVQLGKENPEFRSWAQDVYRYNNHLRTMMVNNGVISQEAADLWQEMYPHYVPIRRSGDVDLSINVPLDTGRTGVNAPVKRATGGNSDILPLFDTMAQRTMQTYKAIAKNSFGVELKNTLGTTINKEQTDVEGVIDGVDNHEELLQEGKNGNKPTFTVFENGEKVTFEITDEMYNAMKPASDLMSYTNPVANTISNIHRGLLTEYNPVFMVTNAIKDAQDILINSQHPMKTYANLPKAAAQIAKNGKWFAEYMENGGEDNTYFDSENNSFDTEEKGLRKLSGIPPLSWISKANNFIERIPRLAEYIASREGGRSIKVSMLDAARVTTNFAAGGKLTKFLNRNGATFLNASVQGIVQQARNIREAKANGLRGWAQLAGKVTLAGLPALLLNNLVWDDDDEYEELSDYVKQNYYIVGKFSDGKFVRIPKGRTLAVVQSAFEQMDNLITGDDEVDLKSFVELVVSNLAPNNPVEDNILAPIIQVANNETWYGEDLVPTRLQNLPAAEQYDESSDAISKWLGEKLNVSPYKINYLLDQYSGGIGDTILPMLTPEAESGDDSFVGNMLAPLKSKFATDSVMNNQNVSDFYDLQDELTVQANSSTATDEDKLMSKYLNSVNSELSELYAQKREWQNSSLPADEKYEKVREIQQQIVDLMKDGMSNYQDISYEGEYARVGDRLYTRNDEGEWQKLSDEQVAKYEVTQAAGDVLYATDGTNHYRWYEPGEDAGEGAKPGWRKVTEKELERQNEITSGLGITPEEYWGNKDEYTYAYDHPERYAVAKAVGGYDAYKQYSSDLNSITADKDKNGKTISGSREEKVRKYIDGLDADYYTKLILYKSEYNSYDDKNREIVQYLNRRDDLSYVERIAILRKLGFEVSANGKVSW